MEPDARAFTEAELIIEVISKNIPFVWKVHFCLAELHMKKQIDDILSTLTVIEEDIKTHPKNNQDNPNKKLLKNP